MEKSLRIIYMGSPEFAVPPLEKLVSEGWNVVAVITAPDKPQGRGRKLGASPVKELALRHKIPVLQPTNLKSPAFLEELKSWKADLQVVVAFRMLPEVVWDMPPKGTFNLHASLLPDYRGAAPIHWAIINGERETGLTTFFITHEIDTGNILFQEKEPIYPEDNVGTLYERLMHKGADLVVKTVEAIAGEKADPFPQDHSLAKNKAPKIFKETCEIQWNKPARKVHDHIRGLSPFPAAWTIINGKTCKILKTALLEGKKLGLDPGEYLTDNKTYLYFQTEDHVLSVLALQMEGKKKMDIQDFFRGNTL
jgi:methionyl-tRNA formyltransferase